MQRSLIQILSDSFKKLFKNKASLAYLSLIAFITAMIPNIYQGLGAENLRKVPYLLPIIYIIAYLSTATYIVASFNVIKYINSNTKITFWKMFENLQFYLVNFFEFFKTHRPGKNNFSSIIKAVLIFIGAVLLTTFLIFITSIVAKSKLLLSLLLILIALLIISTFFYLFYKISKRFFKAHLLFYLAICRAYLPGEELEEYYQKTLEDKLISFLLYSHIISVTAHLFYYFISFLGTSFAQICSFFLSLSAMLLFPFITEQYVIEAERLQDHKSKSNKLKLFLLFLILLVNLYIGLAPRIPIILDKTRAKLKQKYAKRNPPKPDPKRYTSIVTNSRFDKGLMIMRHHAIKQNSPKHNSLLFWQLGFNEEDLSNLKLGQSKEISLIYHDTISNYKELPAGQANFNFRNAINYTSQINDEVKFDKAVVVKGMDLVFDLKNGQNLGSMTMTRISKNRALVSYEIILDKIPQINRISCMDNKTNAYPIEECSVVEENIDNSFLEKSDLIYKAQSYIEY